MADISANFLGIKSPNPFWLASAPPTDKKLNVLRAFEAGWGGVVWKTLGSQIKNVSSRYSSVDYNGSRVMGFNNIELISDRPLDLNLREIAECVRLFPDRAMIVSLMADNNRQSWHELIKKVEDTGAHGLELNFGCPHGMTERGMGAAVGQDPDIAARVVEWVMEAATTPVITKLTPNVHSVVPTGRAAVNAGTNALSLINTIQSVTGVDLDTFVPNPNVGGQSTFGGYCGPAVKPIALKMLTTISQDAVTAKVPISGIGGISTWKDAAEFMLLGATTVQVCTAAMHYGFRIIEDLCDGLNNWMDEKGFKTIDDFIGRSVPTLTNWEELDINYHIIAKINQDKCIHCGLCYISCEDGSHQAINLSYGNPYNTYTVKEEECVGCNLCKLVCPVDNCITMEEHRKGDEYLNWKEFQRRGLPLNDH
ncbi:NAD-dependent dihydropyrimidine dehydrogenase subunit PreA [Chitinophaga ginsengisoli]|uniref:dihydrouracil dehydrogenase (NAD(+)) n=1 Tax=Chitinophaga ginsengisoli TaxID=363837 RepID=A0A2P8G4Q8_9BACT|nr:NAD-dependent dihydropyrimidine dehydrogenase subunit PreA [Chitinophaga ginsengisoli]PSL28963.1 dihydroorotate oxidase B catalytic subunit /dihydrouracil dehydrogenase (NAD+) /dihydropyrimidine dehydrogenase (NADP+) [Chitinophaga ginsengisoli]